MAYLLDTNILSELCRERPDSRVKAFVEGLDRWWLSIIVVHELQYGLERLPPGHRREALSARVNILTERFAANVLAVDLSVAQRAARMRASRASSGATLHLADALIAASCVQPGFELTLATRNVGDFSGCGIALFNPFA